MGQSKLYRRREDYEVFRYSAVLIVIVVILLFSKLLLILFGMMSISKNQVESFVEIYFEKSIFTNINGFLLMGFPNEVGVITGQ